MEIFSFVFSSDDVMQRLTSIFPNSLILDLNFKILQVNNAILHDLEVSAEELVGKNINSISGEYDLGLRLNQLLYSGAFQQESVVFDTKRGRSVQAEVSGFNLGLISDINNVVVLQVRTSRVITDKGYLDEFIYRAAHDLRGPVATIKGLVNLLYEAQITADEMGKIKDLLNLQANKLDERLFSLTYLSGTCHESLKAALVVEFSSIETILRMVIEKNAFVDMIEFTFIAPAHQIKGVNEISLQLMLINLLQFILSLPLQNIAPKINLHVQALPSTIRIDVLFTGFGIDDTTRKGITLEHFLYSDLVTYPQLLNFYAARKIAEDIKGTLHTSLSIPNRVSIIIPVLR